MKKLPLFRLGVLAACLLAASASAAHAALVHHYDFGTSANDTLGTSNATLINGATVAGGSLVTAGGGNGGGGTAPAAALAASSTAGITGDFSVETFFTVNDTTNFATLFTFATDTNNYVIAVARRGDTPAIPSVAYRIGGGTELTLRGTTVLTTGTQYDFVTTYVASTGLASFYVNGVSQATGTLLGINLSSFTAKDGINGNAPYGDPALNGSNADFRIFNNALTAAQVTSLDTLGVNATDAQIASAVPEPGTVALLSLAGMAGLFLHRRRRA